MKEQDLDPLVYIDDMLNAVAFVKKYAKNLAKEQFAKNELVFEATIRQFEIIGEAASKVPEKFRNTHPKIPWKKIIGMRNKLIHDYREVNLEIVWDVIQSDIDSLEEELVKILKS